MEPGQVISGKYRLLKLLGDGGMGSVYEAHHEVLGSRVAIKALHADLTLRPDIVDRFLREARVLAQINNPHVVRVLDIAMPEEGRSAFIVMELLSGEPLSSLLAREGKLPMATAVDYAGQILEALAAAHALGVIHRDLKPENVFVTREPDGASAASPRRAQAVLKLIDFGIAKAGILAGESANLTVTGALMGTPEYMAPEQSHSAEKADARSDIYAVGVMLYEMLAGVRPVDGDDPRLVAMKVERGDIHPLIHRMPDIPRELAGLVHRAMAARPELRFGSAAEMRAALDALPLPSRISGAPPAVAARPPSVAPGRDAPVGQGGTAMGERAPDRPASGRPPASVTDPSGAPSFGAPYSSGRSPTALRQPAPAAGAAWAPPPAAVPAGRGRPRGAGGTVWLLGAFGVLVVAGVALAFTFGGQSTPKPVSHVESVPANTTGPAADPSSTAATPAPEVSLDPALGPLPAGPVAQKLAPQPPPGSSGPRPTPSGSGAPTIPSAVPVASGGIPGLGLPPFAFPSSFPNPFPSPASSGVGPVLTIPTSFPGFGFPPDPGATPPAPAAPSSAPRRAPH